jgi:hypothetical protein
MRRCASRASRGLARSLITIKSAKNSRKKFPRANLLRSSRRLSNQNSNYVLRNYLNKVKESTRRAKKLLLLLIS